MARMGWTYRLGIALAALVVSWPSIGRAADLKADTVKAAFVLNFAKYTQWPDQSFASPESPIHLWVVGNSDTHRAFKTIDRKKIGPREIHLTFTPTVEPVADCHMLFVSEDVDPAALAVALAAVANQPVLTVGNRPDFIRQGGIINIFRNKGRFQFEIKPNTAHQKGLKIRSRLLKLAIVIGD